ncbi:MAG: putative binding protein component of ABC iron transporter precursor [Dehalococcoidia bacterium]|nr:putative binding protein component of ABC iron transporter precursor [Dehalococcoidia bacterium]
MKRWFLVFSIAIIVLLVACTPQTLPAPPAPAPTAPIKAPVPASDITSPTSQDPAWAKVIESARKEGTVNVYTWGWTGDTGVSIAKAFKSRYGISLNLITGRGAEFIARIKTETRMNNITADIFEGAGAHSENMRLEGLLTPAGDLPVLRDKSVFTVDPFLLNGEGYYLVDNQSFLALYVNTNLVKPGEEPKAWVDLLEPKWKGKILFADPVISNSPSYFVAIIEQKRLGLDYLEKLGKQDLMFDASPQGVASRITRGEALVGFTDNDSVAAIAQEGGPIKIIDTREGVFVKGQAVGLVKNGPHPNAAKVLINWILSQEGQDVYTKSKGVLTVRKDVPDYQPLAVRLKPQNPIFINSQYNDMIAKVFAEKQYVPLFKPK